MKMKRVKKLVTVILVGVAIFAVGCAGGAAPTPSPAPKPSPSTPTSKTPTPTSPASPSQSSQSISPSQPATASKVMSWSSPPAMEIDKAKKYTATLDTSLGSFKIQLFASESPLTVNNFVFLSRQGFYNNVIFHRIIKEFMIQTGDPKGTGTGSPGYRFADELPPKHQYAPGIVAMANAGPNTNGSQFFICTGEQSRNLNGMPNYTQFGQVSEGMEIVLKIASVPVIMQNGELSRPKDPPVIKSIIISEQ